MQYGSVLVRFNDKEAYMHFGCDFVLKSEVQISAKGFEKHSLNH